MPTVSFDVEDYVSEISLGTLQRELQRRDKGNPPMLGAEPWTREGMVSDLRGAFYRRDANRMEMLLVELKRHEDAK